MTGIIQTVKQISGQVEMRVSQEEKERSHARIVDAGARLLRERGIEGTGVADVMKEAGLTHGGFYRHFETKDALTAAALGRAFDQILGTLEGKLDGKLDGPGAAAAIDAFEALYLSDGHVANPGIGCPVTALGGEVARGTDGLKEAFGAGVERLIAALAGGRQGEPAERRAAAMRHLAMMVGAVIIARASDPRTAGAVLDACRAGEADPLTPVGAG